MMGKTPWRTLTIPPRTLRFPIKFHRLLHRVGMRSMNQNDQQGPRILIVGGGIAGLILATRLRRHGLAWICLIDRSWVHVWKPMLHTFAQRIAPAARTYSRCRRPNSGAGAGDVRLTITGCEVDHAAQLGG